jgi:hypothetical protein
MQAIKRTWLMDKFVQRMNIFTLMAVLLITIGCNTSFDLDEYLQGTPFSRSTPEVETANPTTQIPVSTIRVSPTPTETSDSALLPQEVEITYSNNAGFLITDADHKILIDAHYKGNACTPSMPTRILKQIVAGESPFDGIDLILVTHNHTSHFDAELVH